MNSAPRITLAIESAVAGGSISLLQGESEVANLIGSSGISRAEDLLANIDEMLSLHNIERREIELIAVSAGPGSFTGIRIGIATALGLKTGLAAAMSSASALTAMVHAAKNIKTAVAALPIGRNAVCLQRYARSRGRLDPQD